MQKWQIGREMQLVDVKLQSQISENQPGRCCHTYQFDPYFGCEYGRVESVHQRSHAFFGRDITVGCDRRLFDLLAPVSLARASVLSSEAMFES